MSILGFSEFMNVNSAWHITNAIQYHYWLYYITEDTDLESRRKEIRHRGRKVSPGHSCILSREQSTLG